MQSTRNQMRIRLGVTKFYLKLRLYVREVFIMYAYLCVLERKREKENDYECVCV